jgi:hypothetical protein
MNDPVVVTQCEGGEELEDKSFDLRGEKGGGHVGEEGFEVMFDEVHDDEDSVRAEKV